MFAVSTPTVPTVLQTLLKSRLVELGHALDVDVSQSATKVEQIEALTTPDKLTLGNLLGRLGRDELRSVCRAHDLPDDGRARRELAARILEAAGGGELPEPLFGGNGHRRLRPREGDIVQVRLRQWLVEAVEEPADDGLDTRVYLSGLDDDQQGRPLEVLWEVELGARVLSSETEKLGAVERLDEPRHFAAYLHALKWGAVSATDGRLLQAPFRAGIQLWNYQLTPLKKALELPRANLFIADDVGLGKTIEAGLVLQELRLRQRVDFVLIVCPASVALQWRDEMERRFGLAFALYNRKFVARRKRERGFAVNPWATSNRFVVSYSTLRRAEHLEPLRQHLGERVKKSLLILDEAHTVAPSSPGRYAIDSKTTRLIRQLAPRFENRLFLSATPHNGHSNSFSALLEILDPQRFTRGVPVRGPRQLEPVLVRRLKEDLRRLDGERFPKRLVVQMNLEHEGDAWTLRPITVDPEHGPEAGESRTLETAEPVELELSRKLAEYARLMRPRARHHAGRLVFYHLQKRLLSSVAAFCWSLQLHADKVDLERAEEERQGRLATFEDLEEDEYGQDDLDQALEEAEVVRSTSVLDAPSGRARELLDEMLDLAEAYRHEPDAKVLALLDWIRTHQCPGVGWGKDDLSAEERRWSDRRVLLFTEFEDTLRWLLELLRSAFEGTDRADERILIFRGGMADYEREEIQRAFNAPPDEHPVRVLLATEAAREGVNLQGHCADLFHIDVPWNPARLEQRNGRIDRTLQPEPEVRCHYFVYPQRAEDKVLEVVLSKVETIRRELGSLGTVVLDRLHEVLKHGIDDETLAQLEAVDAPDERRATAEEELESSRRDRDRLIREIDEAGSMLQDSREIVDFDPSLLKEALDVGLEMAGAGPLEPAAPPAEQPDLQAWKLPELPPDWRKVVDSLRPPRERDEEIWDWRERPPRPVVFRPLKSLSGKYVHLHLEHPFVQRILTRFRSRGFAEHDLSRVTVMVNPHDALARVVAFARLTLFGPGAARLHDRLVSVAAPWLESRGDKHLEPFSEDADRRALDSLESLLQESPRLDAISNSVRERLRASAPEDFDTLWPHLEAEADAQVHEAEKRLQARGRKEADDLRGLLEAQRRDIEKRLEETDQLVLTFEASEADQKEQLQRDRRHMDRRLTELERELEDEPDRLTELYRVVARRLEPVGLVYLWPETRV